MVLSSEQFERIVGQVEADSAKDAERVMLPDGSFTVNRRKETRIPFGQRAKIHLKQDENAGHWSTVMLQDISLQGISFLSDEPLEIGDIVSLCLKEQSGRLVTIESTVQRCEAGGFGGTSFSIAGKFQQILQNPSEQTSSATDSSNHAVADPFEAYGGGDATTGNSTQKKQRGNLASALNPFRLWSHLTKEYDDFSSGSSGSGSKLTDESLAQIAKSMEQGVTKFAAPSQGAAQSHAPSGGRRSSIFIHDEPASSAATITSQAPAPAPVATTQVAAAQPEVKQLPAAPAPVTVATDQLAPAPAQTPTPVVETPSVPESRIAVQAEPAPTIAPASENAAAQAPAIVAAEPEITVAPAPAAAEQASPVPAEHVAIEPAILAPEPEVVATTVEASAPQAFLEPVTLAPQVVVEPIDPVAQPQAVAAATTPIPQVAAEPVAPASAPQVVAAETIPAAVPQFTQEAVAPVAPQPAAAEIASPTLPQAAEEAAISLAVAEPITPASQVVTESCAPVVVPEVAVEPAASATLQVVSEPPAPAPEIAEAAAPAPSAQDAATQTAPAPEIVVESAVSTPAVEIVAEQIAPAAPSVVTAQSAVPQAAAEPTIRAAQVVTAPAAPAQVSQVVAEPVSQVAASPVAEAPAAPAPTPQVTAAPEPKPQPTATQPAAEKKPEVESVSSQSPRLPPSAPALAPEEIDYAHWARRSLVGKRYVYMWAGELTIGQQQSDTRILVLLGAPENGKCELIALHAPIAATPAAWKQLLVNLMRRGLTKPPKLAIADRKLGFWPALADFSPATRKQFSWDNQIAHLLGLLHKGMRRLAEKELRQAAAISNKEDAIKAIDLLIQDFQADAPEAAECLAHEKEFLFTFHDFPAEHAAILRSAAQIQSLFRGAEPLLREDAIRMETKLNALLNLAQRGEEIAKKAA